MEAKEILDERIIYVNENILDYSSQKNLALIRLEEIRKTERVNIFGIMNDSLLTVNVIEPENLNSGSAHLYYCNLSLDDAYFKTCRNSIPIWNETFN